MAEKANALDSIAPHAHWFVRFAMAGIILYHGIDKLQGGIPPQGVLDLMFFGSSLFFRLLTIAEIVAGVLILLGGSGVGRSELYTRIGGGIIAVIMLGAIRFHSMNNNGSAWNFGLGGVEFHVLLAAIGFYFLVRGNAGGNAMQVEAKAAI